MIKLKKFQERMQGVLPPEELPVFFQSLERLGTKPRKSLRIRRDLSDADRAKWSLEKLRAEGIPLGERVPWYTDGYFFDLAAMAPHPSQHPAIAAGLVFIQEAGAMEIAPALEVREDDLVLDLCAAPGAKATHLGEYLGPSGWLVANEPVRDRAKLLDAILARHGIGNSTVFNLEPHRLAAVFPAVFDRVLVDAPCSGESLFAKRSEKRSDVSHKEVERCALRQRAILRSAAIVLAQGGRLVYSTCAYSRAENEDVIEAFLTDHPDFVHLREQRRFPHREGVPGGYFAVLEKGGASDGKSTRLERLRAGIREIGTRGLVRDGRRRWDGTPDPYARLMDRRERAGGPNTVDVALSRESAAEFLLRAKPPRLIVENEMVIFTWEGERIGGATSENVIYPRSRLN